MIGRGRNCPRERMDSLINDIQVQFKVENYENNFQPIKYSSLGKGYRNKSSEAWLGKRSREKD